MRVLIACEFSGTMRDAFRAEGHDAWSCDLLPSEPLSPYHHQGDAVAFLQSNSWDLLIAHPPCTMLCNSGVRWLYTGGRGHLPDVDRWTAMREGAAFFLKFLNADVPRIAVENPIMHSHAVAIVGRPPDQIVQPWQHGHKEMKATGFWLKGLPKLTPSDVVGPPPRDAIERRAWAKVHRASPGPDRWKLRSLTYPGIAKAAAQQWGRA